MSVLKRNQGIECPICGSTSVSESLDHQEFLFDDEKQVMLTALVPVLTCSDCHFSFTDHRAEALRHDAACRHQNLLTPQEIRAIREDIYGFSRKEFSDQFGFGLASVERWENGKVFQNRQVDNYIRLLEDTTIGSRVKRFHADSESNSAKDRNNRFDRDNVVFLDRFRSLKVTPEISQAAQKFNLRSQKKA